jgi:multimeric flavodoxin WrbA
MSIIIVNGGPRKGWNTDLLLIAAEKGAREKGFTTERFDLYGLDFKGCRSCFACKAVGGKSLGRCAVKDGLSPLLDKLHEAEGVILGSPIYINEVTGVTRELIERWTFQYITYSKDGGTYFKRRMKAGLIWTMNIGDDMLEETGYNKRFHEYEERFERLIGSAKTVLSTATYQTTDYEKYGMTMFSEADRKKRREEVFPADLKRAFELGEWVCD